MTDPRAPGSIEVSAALTQRAREIELLIFDVDGVLTDGSITYLDDGRELKSFNVQDGAAIKMLSRAGLEIAIITGRRSSIVERRAAELGITRVYQGVDDKAVALAALLTDSGYSPTQVAHVGDDLADLVLFERVGLSISVPNGHPVVQARADYVTILPGGAGVAREISELLLRAKEKWPYS